MKTAEIEALRMFKGGRLYHAVDSPDGPGRPLYKAECGKEPAKSSGWDTLNPGSEVTCPACRRVLGRELRRADRLRRR